MRWEWMVLLIGTVGIPAGCLLPKRWMPPLPNDKVLHFLCFGVMAMVAGRLAGPGLGTEALALAGVFAAGWLIELLQQWVPGRSFCWHDLAANGAGIAAAAACLALVPAA